MPSTKHDPAEVAARSVVDNIVIPVSHKSWGGEVGIYEDAESIIRRAYAERDEKIREALRRVIANGCGCGCNDPDLPNWHSERCHVPTTESALALLEGGK